MNTVQNPGLRLNTNYVRTPEDEAQDRVERKWKEERNNAALQQFLRLYPTGRVVPRNTH